MSVSCCTVNADLSGVARQVVDGVAVFTSGAQMSLPESAFLETFMN